MKFKFIKVNKNFIGRAYELARLKEIANSGESSIIVVYGRRRVGKTELIEQSFRDRNLLKFEGIEGQSETEQIKNVLAQLSEYIEDSFISKLQLKSWTDVFKLIAKYTSKGKWTLFLDELQWLSSYSEKLISELKYVWDNYLKHNNSLILILCGSSPSFIVNKVIRSKSLYNRSQYELPLSEFNLQETRQYLGLKRSNQEIMDAYLTVGGIPEYLRYLNKESSVFLGLCKNAFITGGFFSNEYERIFTSSLGSNKNYRKIISFLSGKKFAARQEIANYLGVESGGSFSDLLQDLELCGFITKYTPFNLNDRSLLARYNISDQCLQFYFKFIKPVYTDIQNGDYNKYPTIPVKTDVYQKWLGFSFERFCRKQHRHFAELLGFGSVSYRAGSFFDRKTNAADKGFQIDLVFERADKVYTVCEIKYLQTLATSGIISEFERKLDFFPNKKGYTINKILITSHGADEKVMSKRYFDRVLTLKDIF